MKSLFFKRLGAYLFDSFIVLLFVSVITVNFKTDNKIIERMNELVNSVSKEEIDIEEYSNEIFELSYDYQKSIAPRTLVSVIVSFGYFVIFGCLNKGKTLGKKIFKIKVVNKKGKEPSIWNMLGRSIFLYGIFTSIVNLLGIYILDVKPFSYANTIANYAYYGFIIVCMFMVMYKSDNRGLHDIIGGTKVIER